MDERTDLVAGDLSEHLPAPHIRVDRPADDRAGPHDRHLHGEVVEVPRLGASEHLDLGPALDLEEPTVSPEQMRS